MTEIILVDDHPLLHYTIEQVILDLTDCKIVIKAFDGIDLLNQLNRLKTSPSIAIVDIRMPNIDGVSLTQYLSNYSPEIKVIGFSFYNNIGAYSAMMEAGAKGFLCKANIHYLKDAIKTVLNGEIYMDPDIRDEWNKYQEIFKPSQFQNEYNLSAQEIEHLQTSATGLDYEVISAYTNTSIHSLHKRQRKIKEKTGLSSRVAQTMLAIQLGIVKVFKI